MENENKHYQLKKRWYVAYCHARSERKVAGQLSKEGVVFFLPLRKVIKKTCHGHKDLIIPLFSNYVFVFTSANRIPTLLSIPGIDRFVSFGNNPTPVSNQEIAAIRQTSYPYLNHKSKVVQLPGETISIGKTKELNLSISFQHRKKVA